MKKLLILVTLLLAFVITVPAQAADVKLAWDMPEVSDPAKIGVRIKYGDVAPGVYNLGSKDAGLGSPTAFTMTGLQYKKTYYFVAQAYDTLGNFSADSNEVSTVIKSEVELLVIENLRLE